LTAPQPAACLNPEPETLNLEPLKSYLFSEWLAMNIFDIIEQQKRPGENPGLCLDFFNKFLVFNGSKQVSETSGDSENVP